VAQINSRAFDKSNPIGLEKLTPYRYHFSTGESKLNIRIRFRTMSLMLVILVFTAASTRSHADTGSCGGATTSLPFTDVIGSVFFCSIAEAYFSGLTNGTSPTTYSPSANVTRDQMAACVTRGMDQSLKRGSRRAALKQFWTPTSEIGLRLTTVGASPRIVESDGADLWVANHTDGTVSRVRASDGRLLETWTGFV
jgi:S-layer family protein